MLLLQFAHYAELWSNKIFQYLQSTNWMCDVSSLPVLVFWMKCKHYIISKHSILCFKWTTSGETTTVGLVSCLLYLSVFSNLFCKIFQKLQQCRHTTFRRFYFVAFFQLDWGNTTTYFTCFVRWLLLTSHYV